MAELGESNNLESLMAACENKEALDTRDFLSRVADKWSLLTVLVLAHLPDQRGRFSQLKQALEGISQTMLTATLRSLERDGMVTRTVYPQVPPKVEYQLTPFGATLLEPMKGLYEWVVSNWDQVKHAREVYDKNHQ